MRRIRQQILEGQSTYGSRGTKKADTIQTMATEVRTLTRQLQDFRMAPNGTNSAPSIASTIVNGCLLCEWNRWVQRIKKVIEKLVNSSTELYDELEEAKNFMKQCK